jgi:putative methylase
MDEYAQKRLIRKIDLERFLASLTPQPNPQAELEQYTTSAQIAANMLYLAAYTNGDIIDKTVLDLGCGTGRLGLGASFLGAQEVVGIDIDQLAVKTAQQNKLNSGLNFRLINGDISTIVGEFDTVLQNPPFGVQTREADREFLAKALEVGKAIYSLHNHPELDQRLIKMLKSSGEGCVQVQPNAFLERFIAKHGGTITNVYSMLMTIPKMFAFHKKAKHDFVIDLYVIKKVL